MRFIGDVHAKFHKYREIAYGAKRSIQVGDFGIGFAEPGRLLSGHRFVRGNHDNPELCRKNVAYIDDGTVEGDMMFVGGALSVDRQFRTEGVDWWHREELDYTQFDKLLTKYGHMRPRIMVTHTCPDSVVPMLFRCAVIPSLTGHALGVMLEIHKPDLWVFGHWHTSIDRTILGTRFRCLNELEYEDIDI